MIAIWEMNSDINFSFCKKQGELICYQPEKLHMRIIL